MINFTYNGTNCYEICDYFSYFDTNKIYHCTKNEECPPEVPYKIDERKACVKDCADEEVYKYEYNKKCYQKCFLL